MSCTLSNLHANLLACVFSHLTPQDLAKNQRTCKAIYLPAERLFTAMLRSHTTLTCPEGTQNCLEAYLVVQLNLEQRQKLGKPGPSRKPGESFLPLFEQMSSLAHITLVYARPLFRNDPNPSMNSRLAQITQDLCTHLKKRSKIRSVEIGEQLLSVQLKKFASWILDADTNLTALSFRCVPKEQAIGDETISELVGKCQKLETLSIRHGQITDQSLHLLPRLLALRSLALLDCPKITAKGLERLKFHTPVQISCLPAPK